MALKMKITDLRAGGMGVPKIFEVTSRERCLILLCAEAHANAQYDGADIHDWPFFYDMMHDAVDAVARGGGEPAIQRVVDEYAERYG